MDFMKTQTVQNLARSFAGEAQARTRYAIYAAQARRQEQEYLARLFDTAAANELAHAQEFLEALQKHAPQPLDNLTLSAGYPYAFSEATLDNLRAAARGEAEEHGSVYPAFADTARQEGLPELAVLWQNIAVVEGVHSRVFRQAAEQLESGALFHKEQPIVWRCLNCGHTYRACDAQDPCPICGKPQGWAWGDVDEKQL